MDPDKDLNVMSKTIKAKKKIHITLTVRLGRKGGLKRCQKALTRRQNTD